MKKTLLVATGVLLIQTGAFAHDGHTAIESNFWHYLLSPDHLFFGVVLIIAVTAIALRKRLARVFVRNKKH